MAVHVCIENNTDFKIYVQIYLILPQTTGGTNYGLKTLLIDIKYNRYVHFYTIGSICFSIRRQTKKLLKRHYFAISYT